MNVDQAPWDNEKVRQAIAMGIDRARIAENFYPAGSEAAKYFTPCAIPLGCNGDTVARIRRKAGQAAADRRRSSTSRKTYDFHYRTKVRSYLPSPTQVATDIQAQLTDNLGINDQPRRREGRHVPDRRSPRASSRSSCSAGARTTRMSPTSSTYHFGTGANKRFGPSSTTSPHP